MQVSNTINIEVDLEEIGLTDGEVQELHKRAESQGLTLSGLFLKLIKEDIDPIL